MGTTSSVGRNKHTTSSMIGRNKDATSSMIGRPTEPDVVALVCLHALPTADEQDQPLSSDTLTPTRLLVPTLPRQVVNRVDFHALARELERIHGKDRYRIVSFVSAPGVFLADT